MANLLPGCIGRSALCQVKSELRAEISTCSCRGNADIITNEVTTEDGWKVRGEREEVYLLTGRGSLVVRSVGPRGSLLAVPAAARLLVPLLPAMLQQVTNSLLPWELFLEFLDG